jgi:hypothetical protein
MNTGRFLILLSLAFATGRTVPGQKASDPVAAEKTQTPAAPSDLPGKGLAGHDFFYAGEAKSRNMYVVKGGRVVWHYQRVYEKASSR